MNPSVRRNDPCPCGSGKKYKKCCYGKDAESAGAQTVRKKSIPLSKRALKVISGEQKSGPSLSDRIKVFRENTESQEGDKRVDFSQADFRVEEKEENS